MTNLNQEARLIYGSIILYFFLCCLIAFTYDGTGDMGDSISHFQYAQFAFKHPDNFFFHWAKPLFTLFAAPFAQFGFVGIKIFNCLNTAISLFLTYKIASRLQLPFAWFSVLLLGTASLFFTLTFSGLTEHFSALLLLLALWLFAQKKIFLATVVLSFLPFVRSEGLLFLGVTALFLLFTKSWKYVPALGIGHIFYAFLGAFWHNGDLFWVFNKIPYASFIAYGKGNWGHFIEQLYYASSLPLYVLGWLGIIALCIVVFMKNTNYLQETKIILVLVASYFLVFIASHSAFWALGIFKSFGMSRVLNTVMPLFALLGCFGAGFFIKKIKNIKVRKIVFGLLVAVVVFLPFSNNPAAIHFPRDFVKIPEQKLLEDVNKIIRNQFSNAKIYFSNPSVPFYLNIDPFDATIAQQLTAFKQATPLPNNAIIVWDSWFSEIDHNITLENLKNNPRLALVQSFHIDKPYYTYTIFKVLP